MRSSKPTEKSVAVLYFENLSGVKEDEYFRDGITEDIITELSKIRTLKIFPRPTILPYRDKAVTAQQVGRELSAAFVLGGSLRRAGTRLRINTQLMDAKTDFPVWSERYDREMADVFEVQDEIARKIAEALRVTLSPQEQQELAARPTENLQAYDLYLRGKSYARRLTRQDLEFALQMFDNAVTLDPAFALAHAANAIFCAQYYANFQRDAAWGARAKTAADKAIALQPELPDVQVAQAWIRYIDGDFADAIQRVRQAIARKPNCEGAYYLLGRALFAAGRYQEVADIAEAAVEAAGDDYSVYVPIVNALGALGKDEARASFTQRRVLSLEAHIVKVPEDARARVLLAASYAEMGRADESVREMEFARALRPNDASVLYNCACTYCKLKMKREALDTLKKAWEAGFKDTEWARRDPDLALLHGDPEFEKLYPAGTTADVSVPARHDRPDRLALPHHREARQRRDGRRLRGGGHDARPPRGAQVPARGDGPGRGRAAALPARGAGGLGAQPPRDLHRPRDRAARGPALHRDGAARGRDARRADPARGLVELAPLAGARESRSRTRSSRRTPRASSTAT